MQLQGAACLPALAARWQWRVAATVHAQHRARTSCTCLHRRRRLAVSAFKIDRAYHLEQQWQRQLERERQLSVLSSPDHLRYGRPSGELFEVADGQQLEAALQAAGGAVVLLLFYSRSCGICRALEAELAGMQRDFRRNGARLVVLKHDVFDAWDYRSDVSRQYSVRAVPRVLFFVDGAVVDSTTGLRDSRGLGGRQQVTSALAAEREQLRATALRLLLRHAPSARN